MSTYTLDDLREKAALFGELMLVLESGEEYDFHLFTATFGDEERNVGLRENEVRIEGLGEEEYLVIDIPVGRIEHVYSHREV